MDGKSKIVDKSRLENIFNNNKKKRSKDIINNCLTPSPGPSHHVLNRYNDIPNVNDEFGDDFINKILSEKIGALNISENDYILSSNNSNNENNKNNNILNLNKNYEENQHIFVSDTGSLKNNSPRSNLEKDIENITYSTEKLSLSPQKTNKVNSNNSLSDIQGVLKENNTLDNGNVTFSKNKNKIEKSLFNTMKETKKTKKEKVTKHSYSIEPNENINLEYKKKLSLNSFLNSLKKNNIITSVSYSKKSLKNYKNDVSKKECKNNILNNKSYLNHIEVDSHNKSINKNSFSNEILNKVNDIPKVVKIFLN